tara:strand:+ start:374 stop:1516 length:1143 start_codon:yes stop_codon:yes gene_type:complete
MDFIIQDIIKILKNENGISTKNNIIKNIYSINKSQSPKLIDKINKTLENNPTIFFKTENKNEEWGLTSFKNRFYWVSQNKTFQVERREGYLWAPYYNSKKKKLFHWETMKNLKKGDIIFSHYKGTIKCISVVKQNAHNNFVRPKEFSKSLPWMNEGRMVKLNYVDIEPFQINKEFIRNLNKFKTEKNWIYDRNLKHNVVYLLPLPIKAAHFIINQIKKHQNINISDIELFNENNDSSINELKKSKKKSGQGFGLSHKEKKIIENYAMKKYSDKMEKEGWVINDVSAKKDKGFDLFLTKPGKKINAEIKGTTGSDEKVILTKNEVKFAKKNFPYSALIIVSGIHLDRSKDPPKASLGKIKEIYNWNLKDSDLEPINYYYST